MLKHIKYLLLAFLTVFATSAHASYWAEHEKQTKQAHIDTLNSVSRFHLPQQDPQAMTELDLMDKVYASSDKDNVDLQTMLAKFRDVYQTPSQFEEGMKKTVYDDGPEAGHMLIMEFSYVLMVFESLQYPSEQNGLWGYYDSLVKTMGIRISRPGLNEDSDDMRKFEKATYRVLSNVECLFEPDRNRSLSQTLQYATQQANDWVKENKLKNSLLIVEKDAVILNTSDITTILDKIPARFASLECGKALGNEAALLLFSKLGACEQMNSLKLSLDDPSNETLIAVSQFLRGKKALKRCKIEYSELCRMDLKRYESIRELDRILACINPRMMD